MMKTGRIRNSSAVFFAILAVIVVGAHSLHAQAPVAPATPEPGAQAPNAQGAGQTPGAPAPIVRAVELIWPGASAAQKERLLARLQTHVGKPYSERMVEKDIRHVFYDVPGFGGRVFSEAVPDGVKVTFSMRTFK